MSAVEGNKKEQEQETTETRESEDSKVKVGDLYIEWKRKTLNTQASHRHCLVRDYSNPGPDSDDDEEVDQADPEDRLHEEIAALYSLKVVTNSKGSCLGLIVDGGYMFLLDKDMSLFPLLTWHCPKYKEQGCPASFTTRITNPETVRTGLQGRTGNIQVARSNNASHVLVQVDCIEDHANHRPGHYRENINPLIYGLFSRQCREALREGLVNWVCCC